jgi:hypothetical protein
MVPKNMLEGAHAWVHERPIAADACCRAGWTENAFLEFLPTVGLW